MAAHSLGRLDLDLAPVRFVTPAPALELAQPRTPPASN